MTAPNPGDAKARAQVRLPDGRVGTLVWTPAPNRPTTGPQGATMALVIVAGKHFRVAATDLQLVAS